MNADGDMVNHVPGEEQPEGPDAARSPHRPTVTFRGNSYDLTALGALVLGVLVLLMCFTLGQFAYCLPFIAIVLGVIGLFLAKDAVNPERSRLWSWLGIGGAGLSLLLMAMLIFSYFACIFFMMLVSWSNY